MKKIAVYTAVYGDKDEVKEPLQQTVDCDYFLFTEPKYYEIDKGWQIIGGYVKPFKTPRMKAKWWKIYPYESIIADYDYSVWIDGHIEFLREDTVEFLLGSIKNGFTAFRHPEINCIYEEYNNIGRKHRWGNSANQTLARRQLDRYKKEGYPENNGMWAGGILVRDMKSKKAEEMSRKWWRQILGGSTRDQLSLPYVCWKMKYKPGKFMLNNRDNEYILYNGHKIE